MMKNSIKRLKEFSFFTKNDRKKSYIRTYTGVNFYPFDPKPEQIVLEDIIHSLSMQCRFNGHIDSFFSVAQHSVAVSHLSNYENRFLGLMHDSVEAYIGDLVRPIKIHIDLFNKTEDIIFEIIAEKYGLPEKLTKDVKDADIECFEMEMFYLKNNELNKNNQYRLPKEFFNSLMPKEAKMLFYKRFNELYKK